MDRFILAVSMWLGDEGNNSGDFKTVQDKAINAAGGFIGLARHISVALALISFAIGLLMVATGSRKHKEEGKDRMTTAAIALFLSGCVFGILYFVFSIF